MTIISVQLRYDDVGEEFTSTITKLIEVKVTFTKAYIAAAFCVPYRDSFFYRKLSKSNAFYFKWMDE